MGPPRWAMVVAVVLAVESGRLCRAEGEGEVAVPTMPPPGEPIALSDETFEQLAGQTEIMVTTTQPNPRTEHTSFLPIPPVNGCETVVLSCVMDCTSWVTCIDTHACASLRSHLAFDPATNFHFVWRVAPRFISVWTLRCGV